MNENVVVLQPTTVGLPSPEQVFEWPQQAVREHNWAEAAQRWAVIRKAYPEHPAVWIQGASAHIEAGELEQADALLSYAREQFSNNPAVITQSADLAMRRQEWEAAAAFLQQARERFPGDAGTWLKSAEYAEHRNNSKEAEAYNEKARQLSPDHPEPFVQYAEFAMRAQQWEQALARWEEVRSRFPELSVGYHRAAEAARYLHRPREARRLMLTRQYGEEIFDNDDARDQRYVERRTRHQSIGRLLELIWTKAVFNLRSEVHRNYLSYGWWVLEPLIHMVVYYVVFGYLLHRGGENFSVFLLTGLIPWMWFMKSVNTSSNSIVGGQNLMLQVGLPSIVFPLVSLIQALLKQLPVFVLLFAFVWSQGFTPGSQWWALVPVIVVQALLITAFACAVAALIPFVRDLSYLVPISLTLLMFLSGVFYDYRTIPEKLQPLFLLNPMAFVLKCYREILIDGTLPDLQALGWWGLGSFIACLMLMLAYKRLRYVYPRIVTA